jgi:hypothetical protein
MSPCVVRGVPARARPVIFVITPLAGVPSAGVTKVGEFENTTLEFVDPVVPVADAK